MRLVLFTILFLFSVNGFAEEPRAEFNRDINQIIHDGANERRQKHFELLTIIQNLKLRQPLELQEPDDEITATPMFEVVQRQPASLSFQYLPSEFHVQLLPKRMKP